MQNMSAHREEYRNRLRQPENTCIVSDGPATGGLTMTIYVNIHAAPGGDGSHDHPFRHLQDAARIALPGDEVVAAPGIYRESVHPVHAGTPDRRIVYRSEKPLGAVITGAEPVRSWKRETGDVYSVRIPNSFFGNFNPYVEFVEGDWFDARFPAHRGDVYLNGKSMYEVMDLSGVFEPKASPTSWDEAFSVYTWYTEQDAEQDETLINANFHGVDPNRENVEISVRKNCFYPQQTGIGYITLSGFTISKAATQWAPPTALQEGMVGPHWSKGWIIEDCDISESKCVGISLGKCYQEECDNKWLHEKYKDGTQFNRECVITATYSGWDKEHVGSHIVRRCSIHDCGQAGIAGHMGGAFSIIEKNDVYNINNKQTLLGAEIAGIKLHAAIDTQIRGNRIHHCTRGIWLDWEAQGVRITGNVLYDNTVPQELKENSRKQGAISCFGEDIFIEVSHGPALIDTNILLSERSVMLPSQGIAMVHNLVGGAITGVGHGTFDGTVKYSSPRYTPYHEIHSTRIRGFMTILHGDDRFYNNIFVQQKVPEMLAERFRKQGETPGDDGNLTAGTAPFRDFQTEEEWKRMFVEDGESSANFDRYYMPLPVWTGGNVFLGGAQHCPKEENFLSSDENIRLDITTQEDGEMHLLTNLPEVLSKLMADHPAFRTQMYGTAVLGEAFEPEERFEEPDGTPILLCEDIFGNQRSERPVPGPFEFGPDISEEEPRREEEPGREEDLGRKEEPGREEEKYSNEKGSIRFAPAGVFAR